jgi:polysaccharide export outer membrane protein
MKYLLIIVYISVLLLGASCAPKKDMVYLEKNAQKEKINEAVFEGTKIQTGDILSIKVTAFDENAIRPFNLETAPTSNVNSANAGQGTSQSSQSAGQTLGYLVNTNGDITFPVLGRMHILGMTSKQLQDDLEGRLKTYLTDPLVTIRQLNFTITVLGQVNKPGQINSPNEKLNLLQALGLAGDMTDNADRTNVKLIRNENGITKTIVLNFNDANLTNSPDFYLQQNDVLYVQPDANKKLIANNNPNRTMIFSIVGIAIAITTLLLSLLKK